MASAFDWSPGGCCCKEPGWFDLYCSDHSPSLDFYRSASVRPPTPPPGNFTSQDQISWWIDTPIAQMLLFRGITRDGRSVWSIDGFGASANQRISLYDAPSKSQLVTRIYTDVAPASPGLAARENIAVGSGIAGVFVIGQAAGTRSIRTIDSAGTIDDWGGSLVGMGSNNARTVGSLSETAVLPAYLHWPKWAGQSVNNSTGATQLFICDVAKGDGTYVAMTNRQFVRSIATGAIKWRSFDLYEANWAGIIQVGADSNFGNPVRSIEFYIDGTMVWTRSIPARNNFSSPYNFTAPTYQPHVCYPHETLGGGYIAVPETTPVFAGVNDNSYYNLVVYKGTQKIWQTVNLTQPPVVLGSTDRWIYFQTGITMGTVSNASTLTTSAMTNGVFTRSPDNGDGTARYWMAKHDGSEIILMGTLTNTYKQFSGGSAIQIGYDCMMRDSTAAPGTIPGSYQEMWDQRND